MGFSLSRCPPKKEQQEQKQHKRRTKSKGSVKGEKTDGKTALSSILEDLNSNTIVPPKRRKRHRHRDIPTIPIARRPKRNDIFDLSALVDSPPEKQSDGRITSIVLENTITEKATSAVVIDGDNDEKKPAALQTDERPTIPELPKILDSDDDSDLENIPAEPVFRKLNLDPKSNPGKSKDSEPTTSRHFSTRQSRDALFTSVDSLYLQADVETVTVKDINDALEVKFGTSIDKRTRKLVKARLINIISGKIVPVASSQSDSPTPEKSNIPTPEVVAAAVTLETANGTVPDTTKKAEQPLEKLSKRAVPRPLPAAEKSIHLTPAPVKPPAKRRARATTNQTTDSAATAGVKSVPTRRPPRKRAGTRNCSLCTTCPCSNVMNSASPSKTLGDLLSTAGRSEIEIEKNLIRRQKKLEKTADKYESDLDLVTRELKRHRRMILKRKGAQLKQGREHAFGESRFLPDVWDVEQAQQQHEAAVAISDVATLQRKLFGKVKGGQPTLTQMMGGGGDDDDMENETGLATIMEEPELALSEDSDSFDLQCDEEQSTDSEKEAPADNFQRVSWRDGNLGTTDTASQQPVWSIMTSRKSSAAESSSDQETSAWDRMFSTRMLNSAQGGGFDELIGLFESEAPGISMLSQRSAHHDEKDCELTQINVSQLSQPAQNLAESIAAKVMADPVKLARIEGVCPNWRENIRFALLQRGEDDIQAALTKVQESKAKLDKMKEEFLAAWGRQQTVMHLFELSLSTSLQRVNGPADTSEEDATGVVFDSSSEIESDVETVIEFSPLSQEEPNSAAKSVRENASSAKKPERVKSRTFHDETQEQSPKQEVPSEL